MAVPHKHPLIGQVVADRYRVDELLAEGGMGAVYVAYHLNLHKSVALKVVHPNHAGNEELSARFSREAMATSRIDHPNVISAIDCGRLKDGTSYLAVQLVRGPSLTKTLEAEGRLHWARAADLGSQIADALAAAHAHGIIHRDLKPDNVLLQTLDDGDELVKVLDFGVARFARESVVPTLAIEAQKVTQEGLIVGTPGYMAPEQAIGRVADARSDIYSLGVLLWEAVVGKPLWLGDDLQTMVEKQFAAEAPRLRDVRRDPSIPVEFELLVARLLAKRPEDRPLEALAVRDQLREIAAMHEGERPRFRSGTQRARVGSSSSSAGVLADTAPGKPKAIADQIAEEEARSSKFNADAAQTSRSSRSAWVLVALSGILIFGVLWLVLTGKIEVRPSVQVVEAAKTMAQKLNLLPVPPPEAKPVSTTRDELPAELVPLLEQLVAAEDRDQRVAAAEQFLGHVPLDDVPAYVRRMAYLQKADTCKQKKDEVEAIQKLGDPRVLPLLVRLSQRSKVGCGRRGREDCLACLRKTLSQVIEDLEAKRAAGK